MIYESEAVFKGHVNSPSKHTALAASLSAKPKASRDSSARVAERSFGEVGEARGPHRDGPGIALHCRDQVQAEEEALLTRARATGSQKNEAAVGLRSLQQLAASGTPPCRPLSF